MEPALADRVIEITTNVGCSFRCSYCPQPRINKAYRSHRARGANRMLTRDALRTYLSSVPTSVRIHFSGFSEPFDNPACAPMILDAHWKGHKLAVFTTAAGIPESEIAELATVPFVRFCVHLPDADGLMNFKVEQSYIDKLQLLAAHAISNLEFMTLGTPHPQIMQAIGEIRSSRRVHTRAGNISISSTEVRPAYSAEEIAARTRNRPIVCRRDRIFSNVLLPNGDVQLCCMDYGLEETLGNLGTSSYREITTGSVFMEVMRRLGEGSSEILCRRCEYAVAGSYIGQAVTA